MVNISLVSVSIIAWLAYDINKGGENTTQNVGSQGKSVMLDFFTYCSDLCQLTVATSRRTRYIS